MAGFTVSDLGEDNATATDRKELFLEVFSGLVQEAFNTKQLTMERQIVRTITSGKSAQFPSTWKASGGYFTPGDELTGQVIKHGKKSIAIEELLVADVFVDELDELLNHYDIRMEYATQLGEYLANAHDSNSFRAIHLAARNGTSHWAESPAFDGTEIEDAAMASDPVKLKDSIYDAARYLDERDIPDDNRYVALKPVSYYQLLTDGAFLHRDFGGEGSRARANIEWAANLQVLKTNNLPTGDDTGTADVPSIFQYDYSIVGGATYIAAIWHPTAIGTVKLMDLRTEEQYDARYQGTLLLAKWAIGQNILKIESSVTLGDT